jgi:hypothetical protein
MRVAIIGTAGRKEDGAKLSKELYFKMCGRVHQILANLMQDEFEDLTLVSGGAAWADHIAVSLYLAGYAGHLVLHLPADYDNGKFVEEGSRSPGSTANYYHKLFSKKMGRNTLPAIQKAADLGASIRVNVNGFKARNSDVAADAKDGVIALTFGEGDTPKDGGTFDTWNKSTAPFKVHIPIGEL